MKVEESRVPRGLCPGSESLVLALESESWPRGWVHCNPSIIFHNSAPTTSFRKMFSHLTRCAADTPRQGSEVVPHAPLAASSSRHPLLSSPLLSMLFFLSNLIKNCYLLRGPFSFRCDVVFLTYIYTCIFYCFNHFYFVRLPCHLLCYSEGVAAAAAARGPHRILERPFWFFSSDCVVFIVFVFVSFVAFRLLFCCRVFSLFQIWIDHRISIWPGVTWDPRTYQNSNHNLSISAVWCLLPIRGSWD